MSVHRNDDYSPSDWSWIGPWALFMAAFVAFFDVDRSPVKTAALGLMILTAGFVCWHDQREREKNERK